MDFSISSQLSLTAHGMLVSSYYAQKSCVVQIVSCEKSMCTALHTDAYANVNLYLFYNSFGTAYLSW